MLPREVLSLGPKIAACQWPKTKFQEWQVKIILNCQIKNKAAGEILQVGFTLFAYHVPFIYLIVNGSIFGSSKIEIAGQNLFGLLKNNKMSDYKFFLFRALIVVGVNR